MLEKVQKHPMKDSNQPKIPKGKKTFLVLVVQGVVQRPSKQSSKGVF